MGTVNSVSDNTKTKKKNDKRENNIYFRFQPGHGIIIIKQIVYWNIPCKIIQIENI